MGAGARATNTTVDMREAAAKVAERATSTMRALHSGALHGVNLTGWLVLEPWVTPSLFLGTGALDEAGLAASMDSERYAELLAHHRETFITERDFEGIAARGYDAVRLQIPWYVFGEAGPLPSPSQGCLAFVDKAFDWAETYHIGIVLDIALAPGTDVANPSSFFGEVASFRSAMLEILRQLCVRYHIRTNFLGIEPINEVQGRKRHGLSVTEGVPSHILRNFYRDAYDVVRGSAGPEPIFIANDAGTPSAWHAFMAPGHYQNVWLDCHVYHYSESMNASGPTGVRHLLRDSETYLDLARKSGLPVMVGEWSAALPLADAGMTPEGRIALERVYTAGQKSVFSTSAGWFFQTWKTEGRLSSWDARVALSSFEKGMLD